MSTPLDARRIRFARELADLDWSLSVPEPAKAVIRDLLGEVERLAAAGRGETTIRPGSCPMPDCQGGARYAPPGRGHSDGCTYLNPRADTTAPAAEDGPLSETGHRWPCVGFYVTSTERDRAERCTCGAARGGATTDHRCGEWRLDERGACVHCGAKPAIIERADTFKGGDPLNDLAILLMRTWGRVDPSSGVAQHPAAYVATFADMAPRGARRPCRHRVDGQSRGDHPVVRGCGGVAAPRAPRRARRRRDRERRVLPAPHWWRRPTARPDGGGAR